MPTPGPEPRTAVNDENTPGDADSIFRIGRPGSYYLTEELQGVAKSHGIKIEADNVTLDLMGFRVEADDGKTLSGIFAELRSNIVIRNGHVTNWESGGVNLSSCNRAMIEAVTVANCTGNGFVTGVDSILRGCIAEGNSGFGFVVPDSVVADCVAVGNGGSGIALGNGATATGCVSRQNGNSGFTGGAAVSISNCTASGNGTYGFFLGSAVSVSDSTAIQNTLTGFRLFDGRISGCTSGENDIGFTISSGSIAENCQAYLNTGDGLTASFGSTIRGCTSRDNGADGFDGVGAQFIQCHAIGNGAAGIRIDGNGGQVLDSKTMQNTSDGVIVGFDCLVRGNVCDENGFAAGQGAGILVTGDRNRIESNHCTSNDGAGVSVGILVQGIENLIVKNSATANVYSIAAGNAFGPIVNVSAGGDLAAHFNGDNPWANIFH